MKWTTEQILAMAPDASSAKSGRDLAAPRKWVTLGHDEQAAWGECQGSGKLPYQTQVEFSEPAFKCSCPSRKFPCKHALGLFLILAADESAFTQDAPPEWVTQWLEARGQQAERKVKRQEQKATEAVADPKAQAKRAAERQARVAAGMDELDRRLRDLIRAGLATAASQSYGYWDEVARRLVDAQAATSAKMVRRLADIPASGPGWEERLLDRLGRLALLVEGFRRLDQLPEPTQADIRTLIGWNQDQAEVLAGAGVRDQWAVLGQRIEEEERGRMQRIWLWGRESGRPALILNFIPPNGQPDASLAPGSAVDAELAFYAGGCPLRALVKERAGAAPLAAMPGYPTVAAALDAYADALARNPWLDPFPLAMQAAVPMRHGDAWALRDSEGNALPLAPRFERGWQMRALSGGGPVSVFGEWDGEYLAPFSAWSEGRFWTP